MQPTTSGLSGTGGLPPSDLFSRGAANHAHTSERDGRSTPPQAVRRGGAQELLVLLAVRALEEGGRSGAKSPGAADFESSLVTVTGLPADVLRATLDGLIRDERLCTGASPTVTGEEPLHNGSSVRLLELAPGLVAVLHTSADGTGRTLQVRNNSEDVRSFEPARHLQPTADRPILFRAGRAATGADDRGELVCYMQPGDSVSLAVGDSSAPAA